MPFSGATVDPKELLTVGLGVTAVAVGKLPTHLGPPIPRIQEIYLHASFIYLTKDECTKIINRFKQKHLHKSKQLPPVMAANHAVFSSGFVTIFQFFFTITSPTN